MLKTVREQAAGLTKDQRNAFVAAYLGWAMDAFDYFLVVLVYSEIADDLHPSLRRESPRSGGRGIRSRNCSDLQARADVIAARCIA